MIARPPACCFPAASPFGELTSATCAPGVTGYEYNADGQVSSVTYPLPVGTWATPTVNYTYDHAGLLTQVTDFNNKAITIGSTADGRAQALNVSDGRRSRSGGRRPRRPARWRDLPSDRAGLRRIRSP